MRFPASFLDDLRARLPVSEVVGRRVKLKKAGREWKGLSPFNQEKTPSFFVNDQKAAWFDFSSGKNGNIFDFIMLTEGVNFPEAVERSPRWRACRCRASPPRRRRARSGARRCTTSSNSRRNSSRRPCLARRREGARLSGRPRHRAEDAAAFPHRLCAAGALRAERGPRRAGRLGRGHDRGRPAGVRRGHSGALRSLPRPRDVSDRRSARRVDRVRRARARKGVPAKYLNSPETPLFHKGATLYNIAAARQAAHQGAPMVVGRRLCRRDRDGDRGLRGARLRRSARRSPRSSSR